MAYACEFYMIYLEDTCDSYSSFPFLPTNHKRNLIFLTSGANGQVQGMLNH